MIIKTVYIIKKKILLFIKKEIDGILEVPKEIYIVFLVFFTIIYVITFVYIKIKS